MKPAEPEETRAAIARRRLAQLAASFDSQLPPEQEQPAERQHARPIPYVRALATVAVAASVLLVWWLLSGRPESSDGAPPLAMRSASTHTSAAASSPDVELVVDVAGKVRRPGIVTLPPGSRVYEAIEAAGGLKGKVDTATLNLARELTDGEQVLVGIEPVAGFDAEAPATGGGQATPAAKINLNSATVEQLDTLPGVGPVTAQAIVDWRGDNGPFGNVDDLLDVKGIGEATLAELRDLVVV